MEARRSDAESHPQADALALRVLVSAGWRRAQLCGPQTEPITRKNLGAAIGAAGEEGQLAGRKMAFVVGHNPR